MQAVGDTITPEQAVSHDVLQNARPEKRESPVSREAPGVEARQAVGEGATERVLHATPEAAQKIQKAVQDFGRSKLDSERTALATEIYSMAQEVDRDVFTQSLKGIPQDVIDDLGARLGC